eukprot:g20266.t1
MTYRILNSSQELGHKIDQEMKKVCKKGKVMVIMGDLKMQVDWESQGEDRIRGNGITAEKSNYRGMREELGRTDWRRTPAGKTVEQQ